MHAIYSRPQYIAIYIRQVSIDEAGVKYVQNSLSLTSRCSYPVNGAIQTNVDLSVPLSRSFSSTLLCSHQPFQFFQNVRLRFCILFVLNKSSITTSSVCMRALNISVRSISISSFVWKRSNSIFVICFYRSSVYIFERLRLFFAASLLRSRIVTNYTIFWEFILDS